MPKTFQYRLMSVLIVFLNVFIIITILPKFIMFLLCPEFNVFYTIFCTEIPNSLLQPHKFPILDRAIFQSAHHKPSTISTKEELFDYILPQKETM